jgi:uncharacterized pyridoxamine 5'-phosphate oxidase family protein
VYETESQIQALQDLLDASFQAGGGHLLSIMAPERRLTARQLVNYLTGIKHVALATVTSACEPRVSPLDGIFLWGHFYAGTDARSLRARHIRRRPAVSLTHFDGDRVGIVAHGQAATIRRADEEGRRIDEILTGIYGSSPFDLAPEVVYFRLDAERMFTYAPHPEDFP